MTFVGLGGGKRLYADYKGTKYKGRVFRIKYDGKIHDRPSTVGSVVRGGKAQKSTMPPKHPASAKSGSS
jgi:hypothetical protein